MQKTNRKRIFEGVVISNKAAKTVAVEVMIEKRHPKYEKLVVRRKKYMAHTENGGLQVGDKVKIMESRPLSKTKRWRVI